MASVVAAAKFMRDNGDAQKTSSCADVVDRDDRSNLSLPESSKAPNFLYKNGDYSFNRYQLITCANREGFKSPISRMKVFAFFVAVLVASATADTAEFTFANSKLQKFQKAVAAQVSTAAGSISQALYTEFGYLQNLQAHVLSTVSAIGNPQLTADVTAVSNSIGAKVVATFNPTNIANAILAPYQAVFAQWYAQVSSDVASLNTTNPPVKIACLKAVESSINGNITDLSSRITTKVNQQLSIVNARFNTLNAAINADLISITDIEAALPAVSAKADVYIQQNVDAFTSDVATAASKASDLNDIFVKRYTWIGQDLAQCAAASA